MPPIGVAEPEGGDQPTDRPHEEGLVDERDDGIGAQVRGVAFAMTARGVDEQPADVRVGQAPQGAAQAAAVVDVGAVRVALAVGEGVVLAMVGDPGDHGTLDRGRAEHGEDETEERGCLERAVGKEAVKADRDTERRGDVHDREHDQVRAVKQAIPQLPADEAEREDRADRDQAREEAVEVFEDGRLNVVRGRTVERGTVEGVSAGIAGRRQNPAGRPRGAG